MAEQNFLSRKVSRKVKGILDQFPNIGKEIEAFVEESNVGAEAWRPQECLRLMEIQGQV